MSFAAQFSRDGTLNRIVMPKLNCPEAEGILGGVLLKMVQSGDYRPDGSNARRLVPRPVELHRRKLIDESLAPPRKRGHDARDDRDQADAPAARRGPAASRAMPPSMPPGSTSSSAEDLTLRPGKRHAVATGFAIAIPHGYEVQVRPRSGLALKHGITCLNTPGTIDSDYRGEVKVILVNLGDEPFAIRRGERIAQLVPAVGAAGRISPRSRSCGDRARQRRVRLDRR